MALKQLMIRKKLEQKGKLLEELRAKDADIQKRSKELETALQEASTDEEIATVEEEINKIDGEQEEVDGKKTTLEAEISQLEGELEQLENNAPENNPVPPAAGTGTDQRSNTPHQGGDTRMRGNKHETRAQMKERLNQPEVREFYGKIMEAAKSGNARSLSGTDLLIPEVVLNMIQARIGDFSNLYGEVTVQPLSGSARIIMDGAIPEAIWTEMCDPVQELSGAFSQTEIDGYKVGGYIPMCNAILEDSMIPLADYIEGRLAQAIAKALDKAILVGTGAAGKQPMGIITALATVPAQNTTSDGTLANIISKMAIIDDGEDGAAIGEVIAVMKRSTYYSRIMPQTFLPTADGRLVVQGANTAPRLPDGTRIVFSQYAPADTVVIGDFKKYLLGERRGVQLAVSTDVRFIQDETVFKGTARYDGKPIYNEYFVVLKLDALQADASA